MALVAAIREFLPVPLSSFGEAAVNAYAALPGKGDWMPGDGFQPYGAHRIVELGWPFATLGANATLGNIFRKAVDGKFKPDDWSVIHAGALLTKLGARVEFLKEADEKTADIRAWWGGAPVDAEVKTAMVKDRQTELQGIMDTLRQVVGTRSTPWHPLIHLGEIPIAEVQSEIIDAVVALEAGNRMGSPNRWDVYAVRLDQEQAVVDPAGLEQLRPIWWKDDGPSLISIEMSFSGNPDDVRRLRIAAKLPFLTYLNQIREKADHFQGNPNHPFLVVLDQGSGAAMPMRHQRIHDELKEWLLPPWSHVSGVLCFDRRPYTFSKFCWKLSFHPNPNATLPLPATLLELTPRDAELCEYPFLPEE
jgi:hypothetical protein